MKVLFAVAGLWLASTSYAAEKYSLYLVEPMVCTGDIDQRPEGMGEGYERVKIEFTSFYSIRRDGTKANSLEVNVYYAKKGEKWGTNESTWYMGPLRQRKGSKEVYRPELSGRDDALELEIVESTDLGKGKRSEKLEGTWTNVGTVVGDYAYNLKCRSSVVPKPSKTLDFTVEN